MIKNISIDLIYQPFIDHPPYSPDQLQNFATSNDKQTVEHWRDKWVSFYENNHKAFGPFGDRAVGKLANINQYKPAIVIGSGPSLQESLSGLRKNQELQKPLLTISCLHNFGYFQDEDIKIDYYLSLDSGDSVLKDIFEGRKQQDYWDKTKGQKLLAYVGSPPELLSKWQGEIYFFNLMTPDEKIQKAHESIEKFTNYVSCGGNALGACMYIAKCIMGSPTIMYVGADFCFGYDNVFHSYKTGYDETGKGGWILTPDVYGIPRKTWQSYLNFKYWFDKQAMTIPGEWISCSFGTLGAYLGGNLRHYKYMPLEIALVPYINTEKVEVIDYLQNKKFDLDVREFYNNPKHDTNVVFF